MMSSSGRWPIALNEDNLLAWACSLLWIELSSSKILHSHFFQLWFLLWEHWAARLKGFTQTLCSLCIFTESQSRSLVVHSKSTDLNELSACLGWRSCKHLENRVREVIFCWIIPYSSVETCYSEDFMLFPNLSLKPAMFVLLWLLRIYLLYL